MAAAASSTSVTRISTQAGASTPAVIGHTACADCDDADADVFLGQTKFFDKASLHLGFDYDCSGGVDRDFNVIDCGGLALTGCANKPDGYLQATPCGQKADFGGCKVTGVIPLQTCVDDPKQTGKTVLCH